MTRGIEPSTRHCPGPYRPRHAVKISDPTDFSDAVDAAKTLGLSFTKVEVRGHWKAHPDANLGFGWQFYSDIEKAGRKWFNLRFDDGEIVRARPCSSDVTEDGTLRFLFNVDS